MSEERECRAGIMDNPEPLHRYTKEGWLVMLVLEAAGIGEALAWDTATTGINKTGYNSFRFVRRGCR
jgi:hypothetical protein